MYSLKLHLFLLFGMVVNTLYARNAPKVQNFINHKDWSFVENKGQLATPNPLKGANGFDLHPEIKFYGHQGGVYIYCKPGMISFVFTKTEKEPEQISESTGISFLSKSDPKSRMSRSTNNEQRTTISTNRADLVLLGSNPNAEIIASDQQEYYENFYLAHTPEEGITNVHTFKAVTYKNIYPNIDMVLEAAPSFARAMAGEVKYSFIVYPGGKVSDIQMRWNGLEKIDLAKNGGIKYSLGLGMMEEGRPVSFQGKNIVESAFSKGGNRIGFELGNYDQTKPLVIDPTLIWGTYFGGIDNEKFGGVATDISGNVFIAGNTFSTFGIATAGAYRPTGSTFIAKFSSSGSILWASYYGGALSLDENNSIATDALGSVFLSGTSIDDNGIASSGTYQTKCNGEYNNFIVKFSSEGARLWGTYFGGNWRDENNAIAIDLYDNVYITGITSSPKGIATAGAYQTVLLNDGNGNAFLAKFNNNGVLQWATYFGGRGSEEGNALATDTKGNVYLGGATLSPSGIATYGAWQTALQGPGWSPDAFLAKFNTDGALLWSTYFGGENVDEINNLATDISGNVYIGGPTQSLTGIATAGSFQTRFGGGNDYEPVDAFLAKFNEDGLMQWSTYFGGSGQDEISSVVTDCSGNIFIYGITSSKTGITTPDAFQSERGNVGCTFLARFNELGNREWASYYKPLNLGALAVDGSGNVYIAATSVIDTGIATKGAYQTFRAGKNDGVLVKFNFHKYDNDAGLSGRNDIYDSICPGAIPIKYRIYNYGNKIIYSARFDWEVNGKSQTHYFWTGTLFPCSFTDVNIGEFNFSPGEFLVKALVSEPNGLIDSTLNNDTASMTLNFKKPDAQWTLNSVNAFTKAFSAVDKNYKNDAYSWNFGDSTIATGRTVTHTYKSEGQYKISLNLCANEYDSAIWIIDKIKFNIFPNPYATKTNISYSLPGPSKVKIYFTDVLGREICTLLDKNVEAGEYNSVFDAELYKTRPGVYFANILIDNIFIVKKVVQLDSIFY